MRPVILNSFRHNITETLLSIPSPQTTSSMALIYARACVHSFPFWLCHRWLTSHLWPHSAPLPSPTSSTPSSSFSPTSPTSTPLPLFLFSFPPQSHVSSHSGCVFTISTAMSYLDNSARPKLFLKILTRTLRICHLLFLRQVFPAFKRNL